MTTKPTARDINLAELHHRFRAVRIAVERHGRVYFRHLRRPDRKADAVAEMVGLAWQGTLRLAQRGRDASDLPTAIATFAARAVRSGSRVCGQERAKDALSPVARRRHGFSVHKLPDQSTPCDNPYSEALRENAVSPVPDQACFRIDFPAWLSTLSGRDRRIALDLMAGERTTDVSAKHGRSPGRISQMRRLFHQNWLGFHGEPAPA